MGIKGLIWSVELINVWTVGHAELNIIIFSLSEKRPFIYIICVGKLVVTSGRHNCRIHSLDDEGSRLVRFRLPEMHCEQQPVISAH